MKITSGTILREIRIRSGKTLRQFCIENNLDPVRYSLIERNELRPCPEEYGNYLNLIRPKMEDKMKAKMVCAYCGILKPYPDDFPNPIHAMCMECVETETKKEEMRISRLWHNRFLAFIKKVFA